MIPKLDAREVAAVFTSSLHNFLRAEDEVREGESVVGKKSDWYSGKWTEWYDTKWRMHNFYVPVGNQKVSKPKYREGGQAAISEKGDEEEVEEERYRVWGMTARILVETARVAFDEDPEFEVGCVQKVCVMLLTMRSSIDITEMRT
jgi:coenzyme A diphosphatase NUDT7